MGEMTSTVRIVFTNGSSVKCKIVGYVYAGIYIFFMDVALFLLVSFVSPALPRLTNEIHTIGLILGIVSAGIFTLLTETRLGKKEEINIESENIFNFEGAQE